MKIGFIGLGNMAQAMIGGILESGLYKAGDIMGTARTAATCEKVKSQFDIEAIPPMDGDSAKSAAYVAENSDILVLAIKPGVLPDVLSQIKGNVKDRTVILSIVAGKSIDFICGGLGNPDAKVIRCMPNTPALVGEGCTGVSVSGRETENEITAVMNILSSFGKAYIVPEKMMDVVVGVSGSSPAYVFMFIEAMADEAVLQGMPRAQAYKFAAQSVLGSAKMVLETGKHPGELKDMVCSPSGTTIEAVKVLEEKGMRAAVMDAMDACIEKSKKL
ncbi:MAG: pyrroline-5-carboxylate reductase [Lachnospiraceae bacterium]|nr:pyrroline-5-carboxylate reductase [Lachnospiraceae bacterium]